MSRISKYRGKRISKEEWVVGFYAQLPKVSLGATIVADGDLCAEDVADYIIINKQKQHPNFSNSYPLEIVECEQYEVDPDTVGQYIGIPDKNGKEIYEGDIVKDESVHLLGVVKFSERYLQFVVDDVCDGEQDYSEFMNQVEVIGNIYENLDLLKEAENE